MFGYTKTIDLTTTQPPVLTRRRISLPGAHDCNHNDSTLANVRRMFTVEKLAVTRIVSDHHRNSYEGLGMMMLLVRCPLICEHGVQYPYPAHGHALCVPACHHGFPYRGHMYFNCSLAAVVRKGLAIESLESTLNWRNPVVAAVNLIASSCRLDRDPAGFGSSGGKIPKGPNDTYPKREIVIPSKESLLSTM